jgi:cytoskeletal protein CcmA (bactofilin family)
MNDKNGLPTGKHTLVEEGTELKGSITSSCPIVVMGKVEGEVAGPVIHVTATGVVAGNVKVKELRSEGEVAGEVEAEVVRISGKVRDKTVIRARTLEVSLATSKGGMQIVFGECELAVGDEPSKEAAIAAATAPPGQAAAAAPAPQAGDGKKGRGGAQKTEAAAAAPAAAPAAASPAAAPAAVPAAEEEGGGTRRRGTQPPPV